MMIVVISVLEVSFLLQFCITDDGWGRRKVHWVRTSLLDDGLDLRDEGLVDQRGDIEAADGAAEDAEVEGVDLEGGQVEVAEDAEPAELGEQGDLLQLQEGVDVDGVLHEDGLEHVQVQVVDGRQLHQRVQVQAVDRVEVLQVLVLERELVEGVQVHGRPLLRLGAGRGGAGDGGKGADEHRSRLHFCWWVWVWVEMKVEYIKILKNATRAQL